MRDYSDLKFQAQSLCQRSNAILDLIAENELLSRENKELRDKVEHLECMTECHKIDAKIYRDASEVAAKEDGRDALDDPGDLAPAHLVQFDIPNMWNALAGERFTMPEGMTRKEFREWMLEKACSISWPIRMKQELKTLHLEIAALRELPMVVANEYTKLASEARYMRVTDRYIQKANGAMEVHRRMKEITI